MPVDSKGRAFDQTAANQIYSELLEQLELLKIKHTASFSNVPGVILADAAEQLASFGVTSLYNLAEKRWTQIEDQTDPGNPDGQPIQVEVNYRQVYDKTTGREIDTRKLNNSRGGGFTWYAIEFAGLIPIVVAWKEATGLDAFAAQVAGFLSIPAVQVALLALGYFGPIPGGASYLATWSNQIGTAALGSIGVSAAANPLLTKIIGNAAIGTITSGGKIDRAILNSVAIAVGSEVSQYVGQAVDSQTAGQAAGAAAKAAITGGQIPQQVLIDVGIDVATIGIKEVSDYLYTTDDYTFTPESLWPDDFTMPVYSNDPLGTGLLPDPTQIGIGFEAQGGMGLQLPQITSDSLYDWDIGVTSDGTLIGTSKTTGAILAETTDGKTYDVSSIWDSIPSLDDLNRTLKSLTGLATTAVTLTKIVEGKPVGTQSLAVGQRQTLSDGSVIVRNANGPITRTLPDGRSVTTTSTGQPVTPAGGMGDIGTIALIGLGALALTA